MFCCCFCLRIKNHQFRGGKNPRFTSVALKLVHLFVLLCHWLPVLLSCRLRCIFAVGESHCTVGPVYAIACPACILAPRPAVRRNSSVGMRVVNNVVNFSNLSRPLSDLGGLLPRDLRRLRRELAQSCRERKRPNELTGP